MTNEELLSELCEKNRGLIYSLALKTARAFNCLGRGGYTEETLSELDSVGMVAFIGCVRGGRYDPAKER